MGDASFNRDFREDVRQDIILTSHPSVGTLFVMNAYRGGPGFKTPARRSPRAASDEIAQTCKQQKHSRKGIDTVAASIEEPGWRQAIVVQQGRRHHLRAHPAGPEGQHGNRTANDTTKCRFRPTTRQFGRSRLRAFTSRCSARKLLFRACSFGLLPALSTDD